MSSSGEACINRNSPPWLATSMTAHVRLLGSGVTPAQVWFKKSPKETSDSSAGSSVAAWHLPNPKEGHVCRLLGSPTPGKLTLNTLP